MSFPYHDWPGPGGDVLQAAAKEIHSQIASRAVSAVHIGRCLIEVRNRLADYDWQEWLAAEFAWSPKTADNYIRVARRFEPVEEIGRIHMTAMYYLARASAPLAAVGDALEMAQSGQFVNLESAKTLVEQHKPPPSSFPPPDPVLIKRLRRYVFSLAKHVNYGKICSELIHLARELVCDLVELPPCTCPQCLQHGQHVLPPSRKGTGPRPQATPASQPVSLPANTAAPSAPVESTQPEPAPPQSPAPVAPLPLIPDTGEPAALTPDSGAPGGVPGGYPLVGAGPGPLTPVLSQTLRTIRRAYLPLSAIAKPRPRAQEIVSIAASAPSLVCLPPARGGDRGGGPPPTSIPRPPPNKPSPNRPAAVKTILE